MRALSIYEARDTIAKKYLYKDWDDLSSKHHYIPDRYHNEATELLLKSINEVHIQELESVNQARIKREIELHMECDLFKSLYYKEVDYMEELKNSFKDREQILEALILDFYQNNIRTGPSITDVEMIIAYEEHFGLTTKRFGEIEL